MIFAGEIHVRARQETGGEVRGVVADRRRARDREPGDFDVDGIAREHFDADVSAERPAENSDVVDAQRAQHFERDIGVAGNVIRAFGIDRIARRAVTRQVERDQSESGGQSRVELTREDFLARGITVDQQRRPRQAHRRRPPRCGRDWYRRRRLSRLS